MKMCPSLLTAMMLAAPACAAAQNASPLPADGLELLQKVARHYADAGSYFIESIVEQTAGNDMFHQWNRQVLSAAEEPGGRFRFEGRTQFGDAITISDGKTVWNYHARQHRYTVASVPEPSPAKGQPVPYSEMGLLRAKDLRKTVADMAEKFKSAHRLRDAVLVVNGRSHPCAMVSMRKSDLKRMTGAVRFSETVWIDKREQTVLKVVEESTMNVRDVPQNVENTTIYPRTILDGPLPANLFLFSPPADAHEVKEFPNAMEEAMGSTLLRDRVPQLKLKAADGTVTPIESFRGKTVLIDLWATWCAPCVAALPQMAKLAQEGKDKGLVLLAIDRDEDANKAADYLKEKGLALTNFHDGDGKIEALLGPSPLPRDLIIDKDGWVVADGQWVTRDGQLDENGLRARLAQVDPALKDLALKPKHQPPPTVRTE